MKRFAILTLSLALMTGLMALGCGGGGGGSEEVTYGGSTMPSVIDTTGAVELAKAAALAGQEAQGVLPMSVGTTRVPSDPAKMVAYARGVLAGGGAAGAVKPLAVAEPLGYECLPAEITTDGSGGTITTQFCGDEGNGSIKITMSADNFNDGWESIDGVFIMEGTEFDVTIIFRDYFYADLFDDDEDFYADGIVTMKESGYTMTITYNLSLYDYLTDEGSWLDNYRLVVVEDDPNEWDTVTISGRFYDYYGGYVDISTETPLIVPWEEDYPIIGELQMTGDMGYWIKIRFDQDISDIPWFQVEVNIDEDPDYDWQSAWEYWELV